MDQSLVVLRALSGNDASWLSPKGGELWIGHDREPVFAVSLIDSKAYAYTKTETLILPDPNVLGNCHEVVVTRRVLSNAPRVLNT